MDRPTRISGPQRPTRDNPVNGESEAHGPKPPNPPSVHASKRQAGQRTRPIMATRTPRDSKRPQGHGKDQRKKGLERERERKKRERESLTLTQRPHPPPPPPARICLKRGKSHPANNPSKAGTNPQKLPRRMRHHTAQGQREEGQA